MEEVGNDDLDRPLSFFSGLDNTFPRLSHPQHAYILYEFCMFNILWSNSAFQTEDKELSQWDSIFLIRATLLK